MENTHSVVMYVDGSCKPNPGFGGSGVHGYIYKNENLGKSNGDKPSKNVITNIGYIESVILPKYKEVKTVEELTHKNNFLYMTVVPELYINGYYSYDFEITNNIAEILAFTKSVTNILKYHDTLNFTNITFKTDSMYVLHIINTIISDTDRAWLKEDKPNLMYWKEIDIAIMLLKEHDIKLRMLKAEGHSTSIGNHLADRLAAVGTGQSTNKIKEDLFKVTDGKKYWTGGKDRHQFLMFKQIYFTDTNRRAQPGNIYTVLDYDTKDEPGKKTNLATFGVVKLNKKDENIENVIDTYQSYLRNMSIISTVSLNAVYTQQHITYSNLFGKPIYNFTKGNDTLSMFSELPIVFAIKPPGLANQIMERMTILHDIINEYNNISTTKPIRQYIDITDKFYNKDGKKVTTLITMNDKHIMCDVDVDGVIVKLPIVLGVDCLPRNQFKNIEKDDTVVYLVTDRISDKYIAYYILVHMKNTNDISVWCNFYSNAKVLS